jgi:hypothetical protein
MAREWFKAWFWFCPIYIRKSSSDCIPELKPRYGALSWLFELTTWLHHSMLFIASMLDCDIDLCYPIRIIDRYYLEIKNGRDSFK